MNGNIPGIRDFISQAQKRQFLRDFNFRLVAVNTDALALTSDEIIYCTATQLPARQIVNQTQHYMGLEVHYPGSVKYTGSSEYTIRFFMDAEGTARQKLERASRITFNDTTSTGDYRFPSADQYVSISTIDSKLNPLVTYNLRHASIRNVNPITFNYEDGSGALVTCDVTFAYVYYDTSDGISNVAVAQ